MGIFEDRYNRECAEASYWMLYYPDHKADYENTSELDIILSTPPPRIITGGRNSARVVSDMTGDKAVKLLNYDRGRIEEWLKLCDDVEASLRLELRVFLELRRKYRNEAYKDGWRARVEINYPSALNRAKGGDGTNLNPREWVSLRTFREWWDRIVRMTAMEAIRRGLFNT